MGDDVLAYKSFRETISGQTVYLVQQIENPIYKIPDVFISQEAEFLFNHGISQDEILNTVLSRLTGIPYEQMYSPPEHNGKYLTLTDSVNEFAHYPIGPITIKHMHRQTGGIKKTVVDEIERLLTIQSESKFLQLQAYLRTITASLTPDTNLNELINMSMILGESRTKIDSSEVEFSGASEVIAIIPFPYGGRSDMEYKGDFRSGWAVVKSLVAAGVSQYHTIRPHSTKNIEIWNDLLEDELYDHDLIDEYVDTILELYKDSLQDIVLAAPDIGELNEVIDIYKRIEEKTGVEVKYIVYDKERAKANHIRTTDILWDQSYGLENISDLEGKKVIFIDDIVDTSGTIMSAIHALNNSIENIEISFFTAHTVGSYPFLQEICDVMDSGKIEYFGFSDTIDYPILERMYGKRVIKFNTAERIAQGIYDLRH